MARTGLKLNKISKWNWFSSRILRSNIIFGLNKSSYIKYLVLSDYSTKPNIILHKNIYIRLDKYSHRNSPNCFY